jgi:TrkA domain protein
VVEKKTEKIRSIGLRHTIKLNNEKILDVINFYNGRKQIYLIEKGKIKNFLDLDEEEAKELGVILCGLEEEKDEIRPLVGDMLLMDWFLIRKGYKAINKSIEELEIRKKTGATIAAIERNKEVISNPNPKEKFKEGDKVLIIGGLTSIEKTKMLLRGG